MFLSKTLSFFEIRNRIVTIVVRHIVRGDFQKGLRSRLRVSIIPRLNRSQEKDKTKEHSNQESNLSPYRATTDKGLKLGSCGIPGMPGEEGT